MAMFYDILDSVIWKALAFTQAEAVPQNVARPAADAAEVASCIELVYTNTEKNPVEFLSQKWLV